MKWKPFFTALREAGTSNVPAQPARANSRMTVRTPAKRTFRLRAETLSAVLGTVFALGLGAILLACNVSIDICFMITSLVGLGGVLLHEVTTRRGWEKHITARLDETMTDQSRLSREVARQKADIGTLKEGMAETTAAIELQAQRLPTAIASFEARMVNLITQKLGSFGRRPPTVRLQPEEPGDAVLEMAVRPPPRKAVPVSKLEEALNPRSKRFSDTVVAEMVRQAVRQEKIDLYVQPIMVLPQRKARMIELFGRIRARSGIILPAERYLPAAANDRLMPTIDHCVLTRCLQALTDPQAMIPGDLPCMLNIDPAMLGNAAFMKELLGFLAMNKALAPRLIFELAQTDLDTLSPALVPVIEALARLGCGFSMDNVRRARINVTKLKKLRIGYLKLDADWLIHEAREQGGPARLRRLKKQLDSASIDLIVERIEDEDSLRELLDFNIDYGQGFLFAKPENYASWRDRHFTRRRAA